MVHTTVDQVVTVMDPILIIKWEASAMEAMVIIMSQVPGKVVIRNHGPEEVVAVEIGSKIIIRNHGLEEVVAVGTGKVETTEVAAVEETGKAETSQVVATTTSILVKKSGKRETNHTNGNRTIRMNHSIKLRFHVLT